MITGKPPYLKSFDYIGLHRYFLTFCTFERQKLFTTRERVDLVLLHILQAAQDEQSAIVAYCFMPDHVRLLVEAQADDADCRRFISRAKQLSGFHFRKEFGNRLWQRYGYERTLRNDEATLSVARYIFENPLRAGLVSSASEYPFAGSSLYTTSQILESIQLTTGWSG